MASTATTTTTAAAAAAATAAATATVTAATATTYFRALNHLFIYVFIHIFSLYLLKYCNWYILPSITVQPINSAWFSNSVPFET